MELTVGEDAVKRLLATEALHQLKARSCRFVDTKQRGQLRALFAPGARVEGFGSVDDGADANQSVDGVARRHASAVTIQRVSSPEIAFHAADPGWGYYEDAYQCIDGAWLISQMRLTRQRMDALTAAHPLPRPERLQPSLDWL
jgi:hypothetical protein